MPTAALTDKTIEHIRATSVRREVPDGGMPGLYLIVQPSGSKSWAVRYRVKGNRTPKKFTLGPALSHNEAERLLKRGIITIEELRSPVIGRPMLLGNARSLAQDVLDHARLKTDPKRLKGKSEPSRPEGELVEDVIKEFLERYALPNNRKTTWRELARILRFRIDPNNTKQFIPMTGDAGLWKGRRIADITKSDVLDFVNGVGAPVMANRTFAALRRLFNWCVEQGKINQSPCKGSKAQNRERKRDRVLNKNELVSLWNIAESEQYPFGPLIQLLILTGQRREEVAGLRWREINFDEKIWTIPAARAKNDIAHEVPLSEQAIQILQNIPRVHSPQGLIFSTTGSTSISGFSRLKIRLDKALGAAEPWTIHDIRRTVASGMAAIGVALPVIEKVLNHISESFGGIVGVYQRHEYKEEKRAALDAWARVVTNSSSEVASNVVAMRGAA
jgi:integrase